MRMLAVAGVLAAIIAGVVYRDRLRNTVFATINRRRMTLDRTGNRTNDIPSRRGELPLDLRGEELPVDLR
jgi:hypothetical protein